MNHRNAVAYYFSRWFDEPFCVEMLNMHSDGKCRMASDDMDQKHCDYYLERFGHFLRCDSKTVSRSYRNPEIKKNADVITVGNYVLTQFSRPDIISFFYSGRIYLVPTEVIERTSVWCSNTSSGDNRHRQTLSHYLVSDLISCPETESFQISEKFSSIYNDAYVKYDQAAYCVRCASNDSSLQTEECKMKVRLRTVRQLREDILKFIRKFNDELAVTRTEYLDSSLSSSLERTLSDVYCLISC